MLRKQAPFKITEHTADIGIAAWGATLEESLGNAVLAMFSLISDPTSVDIAQTVPLKIKGANYEELLFNLLDDLLYRFEVHGFLAKKVEVQRCTKTILEAVAHGEERDRHHHIKREIKSVTYHRLKVEKTADGRWKAQAVFDI